MKCLFIIIEKCKIVLKKIKNTDYCFFIAGLKKMFKKTVYALNNNNNNNDDNQQQKLKTKNKTKKNSLNANNSCSWLQPYQYIHFFLEGLYMYW